MKTINDFIEDALRERTCYKHPVAAAIETRDKYYVLGWNGAPEGIAHDECLRKGYPSGEGMQLCPTVHAERRAISRAAKDGIELRRATLYMSEWFPCADCAKSIIEAGIERLITPDEVYSDKNKYILVPKLQNKPYNFEMAEEQLRLTGVEIIVNPRIRG